VDGQATGTIVDDDGLPSLAITDQTVNEGNSGSVNAVFEVTLSPVSAQPVTVDYTTTDGTAVSGSDYTAISGTLTFTPGETSKFITVSVKGDLIDEGDSETFTVDLSNETNANLADGQGLGTILDDDLAVVSISAGPQVIEGDAGTTTAVFTVTLSRATAFTVTVDYATADGYNGAEAGSDYEAISGTLTFVPGETIKIITVTIYGDTTVELDETFLVRLSNPDPINTGANASIATIINDDFRVYLPLVIR
jgi:chitinase